ncbi:hypothetical protein [Fundidesulfovibrio terrae]|uniref:hypothetical protein n=1 Tax=Fundidesulfovibrio terrae TaxID=2922866 RepID=UPI001FAFD49B|nr:hypothetical protein [Fundidesulfovibrio terrae]
MNFTYEHYIVACGVTTVLAMVDILSAFPVPRDFVMKLVREFWYWIYVAFYVAVTFCVSVILNEQGVISQHPWSWAFGLGLGIPLALQAGIKFNTPWLQANSAFSVGLQNVADRVRAFCYLHITTGLNERHLALKRSYLAKSAEELEKLLCDYLSPDEMGKLESMLKEAKDKSEDELKALLVTLLFEKNPELLKKLDNPAG